MTRYQTRMRFCEARKVEGDWPDLLVIAEWCGGERYCYVMEPARRESWFVTVPNGRHAMYGEYVVRVERSSPELPPIFYARNAAVFDNDWEPF